MIFLYNFIIKKIILNKNFINIKFKIIILNLFIFIFYKRFKFFILIYKKSFFVIINNNDNNNKFNFNNIIKVILKE